MTASVKESRARAEAQAAKVRMTDTIEELKVRLAPGTLAGQAVQAAKDKSIVIADDTVTAVKEKPLLSAGVAAGTALFLARRPLISAISSLFRGKTKTKPTHNTRRGSARVTEDFDDGDE